MKSAPTASVSGRVAQADLDYLLAYPIPGQTTVSEKLRYLVAFFRTHHESLTSLPDCLRELDRLLAPALQARREAETALDRRSEVVAVIAQAVPLLMARLIAEPPRHGDTPDRADLEAHERALVREAVALLDRLLRLALTAQAPAYRPEVLREELRPLRELIALLFPPNQLTSSTLGSSHE